MHKGSRRGARRRTVLKLLAGSLASAGLSVRPGDLALANQSPVLSSNGTIALQIDVNLRSRVMARHGDTLEPLKISAEPFISGFLPNPRGYLDDHVESWFLTQREAPPSAEADLKHVVQLGLSQDWLKPPNRAYGDELIRARYGAAQLPEAKPRTAARPERATVGANGL